MIGAIEDEHLPSYSGECIKENIINKIYVIFGFFIVIIIYESFTYLAIYVAKDILQGYWKRKIIK